jgi:uncharacterized protein (TIGR00730 family)
MRQLKSLCIYCGSSTGASDTYAQAARAMAKEMVDHDIALVYGGGSVGLMGIIADEVMKLGGNATGVIPKALMGKEVDHRGLTHLHVVKDMHERKAMMAQLADGFVAMPGGLGTLEELFEALTWSQLGFHDKPIGLLNVDGFYDGLIQFIGHMVTQRFLTEEHASLMMHAADAPTLLTHLQSFEPVHHTKWLDRPTAKSLLP